MPTTKTARPAVQCQTSHKQNCSNPSIPHLSLELELSQEYPESMGIDSFSGNVRSFRLYLSAQEKLLKVGAIV